MTDLIRISKRNPESNTFDIIFVHGLDGNPPTV